MKKIIALTLVAVFCLFTFASCTDNSKYIATTLDITETEEVTTTVLMKVKGFGDIVIELYPDTAPITVENFQKLVSEGFYDGLTFHRIISGFMIQGGDPKGDGNGGSTPIKGEFSANGVENDLKHTRGVISMARRGDSMDSGSCQFFIMHQDYPSLNGQYASFGKVLDGMSVVDDIAAVDTDFNDKPLSAVQIEEIVFVTVNK